MIKEYPQLPILYNYLGIAYLGIRDRAKAKEIIVQNYTQNPDYLFARINYAELYLATGDYAKIAEIFDHKFDLQLLYPKRKRFHISEYLGFMGIIGPYFLATGERELAVKVYEMMQNIDPSHSMTKRLRRQLYPGPLMRLLKWLSGKR